MIPTAPPAPEAGAAQAGGSRLQRWWAGARASAWGRGGLFLAFAGVLSVVTFRVFALLGWTAPEAPAGLRVGATLARQIIPTLGAFLLLAWWVERRRATELSLRHLVPGIAAGVLGGVLLIGAVFGTLWLAGAYQVQGWGSGEGWWRMLLIVGVGAGISEEIIFRGVLYRLIAESKGDAWALGVSALLFGGVHLGNPNASLWTSFAIAVEAGILLGAVYALTRSLWPCIGLHMAWNFLEGKVFGSPVSGNAVKDPFLQVSFDGPAWLTGGAFGVEGSVVTVALSLLASATLLLAARRRRAPSPDRPPSGDTPC
ncbi:lysostaphin resistance A-like protein [Ramlibacter sp.]|uniref:CPBP family intramembrane glutamic endopeptidase n=1 Tax=Ramlibacter sp. TaxID=1917967 RepID=UPI0035B2B48B